MASRVAPAPKRLRSMAEIARSCVSDSMEDSNILSFPNGQRLVFVPFSKIRAFAGHPFRLYEGERLADMVESIRQNGILMPLIIRCVYGEPDAAYEMLSGHNRMNAGILAGLDSAWCVVKDGLSDAEALMYVIETNLMQRAFTDLLPSEKAAVLTMRYSDMFSQGKRNDILRELRLLEDPNGLDEELPRTCGSDFHRLNSREVLGREYSLTGRSVANYLRIHKLIDGLKARVDNGGMTLAAGVSLSYLSNANQQNIENTLGDLCCRLTDAQASLLRKQGKTGIMTIPYIRTLLAAKPQKGAGPVRVRHETYAPYFPASTPAAEIERVIGEALRIYFAQQVKEDSA